MTGLAGVGRSAWLLAVFATAAIDVSAQEDYRAADLDRPTRVEDANAIEFRAWELEVGSRSVLEEGAQGVDGILELNGGLFRNLQVGVEVEGGLERIGSGGGTRSGLESVGAHAFFGLRRETVAGPALALRIDAATPGRGDLGHQEAQLGLKGILSRSFGRLRMHGNGGYVIAGDLDGGDYWRAGLAGDYPLGLISRSLLTGVYAEMPASGARARVWAEVGLRVQVSNISVLDLGLATRVDQWEAGEANVEIVIGFARVFGRSGRVAPYPDPSIR